MTKKKKEEIPPQPIGKGLIANMTWLFAFKTVRIAFSAAIIGILIAFTVAIIASTEIHIDNGKLKMHKETTNLEKLQKDK